MIRNQNNQEPVLRLSNVTIKIGEKVILDNINFDLNQGDFVIIVGGNGAGKSTLFDVISGKRGMDAGNIFYQQKSIKYMSEIAKACFITRIFQNTHANCVGNLTVLENVALSKMQLAEYGFSTSDTQDLRNYVKNMLLELDMSEHIIDTPMFSLSGGQRQLIAFVMSMFMAPQILLLDEPTAALDPQAATKLLLYAKKFIQERNIPAMLITHDPYIAMHLGNRIFVLENGTIKKMYNQEEKKTITDPSCLLGQIQYNLLD